MIATETDVERTYVERGAAVEARLDRIPVSPYLWKLIALLSLGGFFEFYELFMTAFISPASFVAASSIQVQAVSSIYPTKQHLLRSPSLAYLWERLVWAESPTAGGDARPSEVLHFATLWRRS